MLEAGCRVEQLPVTISPVTLTLVFLQIGGVGVEKCHWSGLWRGGELYCPDWQSGKGECGGLLAATGCYWLLSHSLREVCDFWHSGVQ